MTKTTADRFNDQTDHGEFHSLLEAWAAAIVANDADRIAAFAEPNWELVTPEGGPVSLNQFLSMVRDGTLTHTEMVFDVLSVHRHGDVATVVAHGTNRGVWNGAPFAADEWVTEMFVRRGNEWRCVISALTPRTADHH